MWKSIKKFFKWIADHTGISWIARKFHQGGNGCLVVNQVMLNKIYHQSKKIFQAIH